VALGPQASAGSFDRLPAGFPGSRPMGRRGVHVDGFDVHANVVRSNNREGVPARGLVPGTPDHDPGGLRRHPRAPIFGLYLYRGAAVEV